MYVEVNECKVEASANCWINNEKKKKKEEIKKKKEIRTHSK